MSGVLLYSLSKGMSYSASLLPQPPESRERNLAFYYRNSVIWIDSRLLGIPK